MTDADTLRDMLTRAKIPFIDIDIDAATIDRYRTPKIGHTSDYKQLPPGSYEIRVDFYEDNDEGKSGLDQPYSGGYSFDHAFHFDADGNLIALWGWE